MSDQTKLSNLLISQEKVAWLKSLETLKGRFAKRELAQFWCELNARRWPSDIPINQLSEESEQWNQDKLFEALQKAVDDDLYLTLHWRASQCRGKIQRIAISELALIDGKDS